MLVNNVNNWIDKRINRNCSIDLPSAMFDFSIKTVEDARKAFPGCREGRGLTPLDRTKIIMEIRTPRGYLIQLIKNDLEGKHNWVQITY